MYDTVELVSARFVEAEKLDSRLSLRLAIEFATPLLAIKFATPL